MTKELIANLRLGASISRDRKLNLDYAKVADEAADCIEALQARCAEQATNHIKIVDEIAKQRDKLAAELQALREQVPKLIEAYGGDLDNVPAAPVPPVREPVQYRAMWLKVKEELDTLKLRGGNGDAGPVSGHRADATGDGAPKRDTDTEPGAMAAL